MSFSQEWDDLYAQGQHLSVWPWSDLVSIFYSYAHPKRGYKNILEIGCGAGANIRLFDELGCDYFAIEGSPIMVAKLKDAYPHLAKKIVEADFTREIPFDVTFDCIIDRSSLTCNRTEDIKRSLNIIYEKMRLGGKFIGIDWFSKKHSSASAGVEADPYTRTDITEGHLAGTGNVHFSDADHIKDLFGSVGMEIILLDHKIVKSHVGDNPDALATWNFIAEKK